MSIKQFNQEVLGVVVSAIPMLMSAHLQRLAGLTGINAEVLLDQHTVFPYVTAFLPEKQVNQFRRKLLKTLKDGLKSFAALIHGATTSKIGWRFCQTCAIEDVQRFGESYWHRSHLLPGVLICKEHGEMLVEIRLISDNRLALPHDAISQPIATHLAYEKLTRVAIASIGKLGSRSQESHQTVYRQLANEAGYRITKRDIAARLLSQDLANYYGKQFLAQFECAFTRSPICHWPSLMIRLSKQGPFSPIKHILLQVYLEQAPKEKKQIPRKKSGKTPRDYRQLDEQITVAFHKAVAALIRQDKTINAWDLLKKIGAWHIYRHNRQAMPKTKAAVESFRQSDQCSWKIFRRSTTEQ
jgi:hypothetical protein